MARLILFASSREGTLSYTKDKEDILLFFLLSNLQCNAYSYYYSGVKVIVG
jgi:hypothetical protein